MHTKIDQKMMVNKLSIWFPIIRTGSGSDVYYERLAQGLQSRGISVKLQWFNWRFELFPDFLRYVKPPLGTNIIHSNTWSGFTFTQENIPLVVTAFHCIYKCGYPIWKSRLQALYHNYWIGPYEKRSFSRASAVVVMTSSAAAEFQQRFTMPPCTMIYGWVDTKVFKPIIDVSNSAGIQKILIVGNNSKRKGMDLIPQLRKKLDIDCLITVVGGLRNKGILSCRGVTVKGGLSVSQLVHEYQSADIIVSLSRYEGFGYSALEAMACGKPVVAFDVVGLRDVIVKGVSGFLVPVNDVDAIVASCKTILNSSTLASCMGSAGRNIAVNHFNQDEALDLYLNFYSEWC